MAARSTALDTPAPGRIRVRAAVIPDVPGVFALVAHYAALGRMLFRTETDILAHIEYFAVALSRSQHIVGCAAIEPYTTSLAEIRSVAVDPAFRHARIGTMLLRAMELQARARGIRMLFALTLAPAFFTRFGYRPVRRELLTPKIEKDCSGCPLNSGCREIAVIKRLGA